MKTDHYGIVVGKRYNAPTPLKTSRVVTVIELSYFDNNRCRVRFEDTGSECDFVCEWLSGKEIM